MSDWLRLRGGGETVRMDVGDELVVGRGQPGSDAFADDEQLSRRHARFARTDSGSLTVEDLGTVNGSFVNGQRVSGVVELRPGDVVLLGATELEVVSGAAAAPPAGAAPPPSSAAAEPARRRDYRVPVLAVLLLLALAGLAAALAFDGEESGETAAAAEEPAYDGTAYVLSNRKERGANTVIAIRYGANGFDPLRLREYPTRGSGSGEAGLGAPTDGDQQVQVDTKRKLVFAVNQGSDTVAVFRIEDDGGLEHVEGSPFPSGGTGPISVGLSDATVLVVNKGYDGARKVNDPGTVAQFQLGDDGSLTPVAEPIPIGPGTGPTQALVVDRADMVVVPELVTGPYRTLRRREDGTFRAGSMTPVTDEQRDLGIPLREALAELLGGPEKVPRQLPPAPMGSEGLSFHPEENIVYSALPPLSLLMVHSFDESGRLRFERGVPIQFGLLACWTAVTPDGRWLYVSNAATHTVAGFDVSNPRNPRQTQVLQLAGGGGHTFNLAVDPTGKHLFVLDSFASQFDRPGLGNQLHMLSIGLDGQLSIPPRGGLVRLPVSFDTNAFGLALARRVALSEEDE